MFSFFSCFKFTTKYSTVQRSITYFFTFLNPKLLFPSNNLFEKLLLRERKFFSVFVEFPSR